MIDGTRLSHGAPQFLGSGAPATAADQNAMMAWVDLIHGLTYATAAGLPAASTDDLPLFPGLKAWVTSDKVFYVYNGTSWVVLSGMFPFETRRRSSTFGVALSFAVLDFDTQVEVVNDTLLDYSTGVFTTKLPGRWHFHATVMASNAVNSYFNLRLLKGATVKKQIGGLTSTTANTSHDLDWEGILAVNDTIQFQQSGGSTSIVGQFQDGAGNYTTDVLAEYMGPA